MFELFAFGEATTFNLLRPLVKQVAFFAFVKQKFVSLALIIFGAVHIFCPIFAWRAISAVCSECQCGYFKLKFTIIYACPKGTKLRTCTYHFHYANIIFICPNISFNPNSSKLRKNRQSRVQIRRSRVEIRRSRVEIRRS